MVPPNQYHIPEMKPKADRSKRSWKLIWIIPLAGLTLAASPLRENYFELSKQLEIMTALFRELNIYYVDELQPGELMETGINAMVSSLDPYTIYYPESRVEDLRFMSTGEYGGIGASIQTLNNRHLIVDVLPEFPAAKAGLQIGDELLEVDGQLLSEINEELIPEMLQGASGTEVTIRILGNGASAPTTLTLTRENIKLPAVPYSEVIGDSTGYVILSAFTRGSSFELRQAIRHLQDSAGINQLIIDLRGNGGGLLQESIAIVNLFVPKGEEVVSTKGKNEEWMKSYTTRADPLVPDLPLAILIDGQSASASEIVAGTLQDLDRAIIVGEDSFGKGLVQQSKPLAYGTKLKVTVAKYYTASGRCIQRLDYGGERSEDGAAQARADSLIQIFHTRNGRPVVDGKGIQPDIYASLPSMSYVLEGLYMNGVIFEFANAWCSQRDSIAEPLEFSLTEEDWEEFIEFAENQPETEYQSRTLALWNELEKAAEEEQYLLNNQTAYQELQALISPNIRRDLNRFKPEIVEALEEEVIMRYHMQPGVIEWSIPKDSVLHTAITWLSNGESAKLLSGTE